MKLIITGITTYIHTLSSAILLYLFVAGTAVAVLGSAKLSQSSSPLAATLLALGSGIGPVIVSTGALLTTFNEALSDLLGLSRVGFAMGQAGDLPKRLAHLGPGKNPWPSVFIRSLTSISDTSQFITIYELATILIIGAGLCSISEIAKNKLLGYPGFAIDGFGVC